VVQAVAVISLLVTASVADPVGIDHVCPSVEVPHVPEEFALVPVSFPSTVQPELYAVFSVLPVPVIVSDDERATSASE